jgi:hypothetical protein
MSGDPDLTGGGELGTLEEIRDGDMMDSVSEDEAESIAWRRRILSLH